MRDGWVYIVTNKPNGILYIGVTSDLGQRIWQHRTSVYPGFTKRFGLHRLVWYESHDDIKAAIQREHNMKHWRYYGANATSVLTGPAPSLGHV